MSKKTKLNMGADIINISKAVNQVDSKVKYNLQTLKLDKIVPSEKNNFGIRDIDKLAESLKNEGLLHNIVVRPIENGKYEIISGERRYRAAKEIGWEEIPAKVIEADELLGEQLLILANLETRDLTDKEKSENAVRLLEIIKLRKKDDKNLKGKTRDIVAKELNVSGATVQKMITANKLIPELDKLFKEEKFNLEMANQYGQLSEDVQMIIYQTLLEGASYTEKQMKAMKSELKEKNVEAEEIKKVLASKDKQIEVVKNKAKETEDKLKAKIKKIKSDTSEEYEMLKEDYERLIVHSVEKQKVLSEELESLELIKNKEIEEIKSQIEQKKKTGNNDEVTKLQNELKDLEGEKEKIVNAHELEIKQLKKELKENKESLKKAKDDIEANEIKKIRDLKLNMIIKETKVKVHNLRLLLKGSTEPLTTETRSNYKLLQDTIKEMEEAFEISF